MHLYGSIASPFVQRVLMTARAKGHALDLQPPLGGSMRSDELRAISPMGRIPLLAFDDGTHLCESAAIAAYLDETLDGPALLPATPLARARVREIVAIAVGEIAVGMRPLMVHLVFRMSEAPQVVDAARAQIAQGLDALDRLLDNDGFATGDTMSSADCALVPILSLMHITDGATGAWTMAGERSRIAAYLARMEADPIARRTLDEMAESFAAIMARNAAA